MKRLIALILILASLAVLCSGQRRQRTQIIIQLTKARTKGTISFEEALSKQRNVLVYTGQPIDRDVVSQLAWAGLGYRAQQNDELAMATNVPVSAIQLIIVSDEGIFGYQPAENNMLQMVSGDVRSVLARATSVPNAVAGAGCIMILTAPSQRLSARRSSGSRSSVLMEAGQIAQNIQLQAVCLDQNLGTTAISEFDTNTIIQTCNLLRSMQPLIMICVGYMAPQSTGLSDEQAAAGELKKAAVIVPGANFQDAEFFATLNALDAASVRTVVASNTTGVISGMLGSPFQVGVLVNQIRVDDYDAVVIIGGGGAVAFINDIFVLNIIREAFEKRKIIGATSEAAMVLANAGILQGIKVTGPIAQGTNLRLAGALYTNNPVEQDMKVITCSGPQAARTFAIAITDAITAN